MNSDHLNIEPASRFKNAAMNWLLETKPTGSSKNTVNGFIVEKKKQLNIDFGNN